MAVQKRKPRKKKSAVYHVIQNAKMVVDQVMVTTLIFTFVLISAGSFILFQWKNIAVNNYVKDNEKLKTHILKLNSEKSVLEQRRNDLLKTIPKRAEKLGLYIPSTSSEHIVLSMKKMNRYE